MLRNLVIRRCESEAIKLDLRAYNLQYTSPNEHFEYGYPHSNALLQSRLKLECCKPNKATRHPTKCDVINDVKLFPTDILSQIFDVVQSNVAIQKQVDTKASALKYHTNKNKKMLL